MAHRTHTHVTNLSNEHSSWKRAIAFYNDELVILKKRLQEVSFENTSTDVKAEVEHYQNQFIIQEKNLQDLKTDIDYNFELIGKDLGEKAMHVGNSTMAETDSLRDRYIQLEKTVNELRHSFNRFFCDHMDVVLHV